MSIKQVQPVVPDQWLLLQWRRNPEGVTAGEAHQLVEAIRQGCERGRYWLRAYAALPDRLALLLYPLEEPARVIATLEAVAGCELARLRPMRDDADLERTARFVEGMPVRSHLSQRPEDYPWSNVGWIREFIPAG